MIKKTKKRKKRTQRDLRALKGSIKKWEKIVEGRERDRGHTNCPLCRLFFGIDFCGGCPVAKKGSNCLRTPYAKWVIHHNEIHFSRGAYRIECKTCEKLAKQEVKFLKSLLPKK